MDMNDDYPVKDNFLNSVFYGTVLFIATISFWTWIVRLWIKLLRGEL